MNFYCDSQRHLVCVPYSIENLHLMASQLNIKRCWFHNCRHAHYDVPKKRVSEIKQLCKVVARKDIVKIIQGERVNG